MTPNTPVNVTALHQVIRNDQGLYQGNLIPYYKVIFLYARNLANPYHNFRHMFHVFWLCYSACVYYAGELSSRSMRNLLIAALFHDFDHSGQAGSGHDDLEIERALRGLRKYILEEDKPYLAEIERMIRVTQFPYVIPTADLQSLEEEIIRDADMCQALDYAWLQQVIFGLSQEMRMAPAEVLAMQKKFLIATSFLTEWARQRFPRSMVEGKIEEAETLHSFLA